MDESDAAYRHYTTGEIVLVMLIVAATLAVPVFGGLVYFFFYM